MLLILESIFNFPNTIADNWASLSVAFFTGFTVVVNAIFVYLVWRQISQTNEIIKETKAQNKLLEEQLNVAIEETDNKMRPWIAVADIIKDPQEVWEFHNINFKLHNFGDIPAIYIRYGTDYSNSQINKDKKVSLDGNSILMPNQEMDVWLKIPSNFFKRVTLGELPLYIILLCKYTNSRNEQEHTYIVTYEYDRERNTFSPRDSTIE